MDHQTMRRRLAEARVGRLATVTASGRPHVVPCCFALDGDTVYSAVDHKPKTTHRLARLANMRATGVASLLVDHYDEDWTTLWWVRVDGRGRVVETSPDERDRALGLLQVKYEQYRRQPPTGPVAALDITTWRSWP